MGGKAFLGLALCVVACGESGPSGLLRRPSNTDSDAGLDASATGGTIGAGGAASSTGGRASGSGGAATTRCQSDRDCTPFRLLCDHARALCVQCLAHVDCNHGESCQGGVCEAPIQCTNSLDCVGAPDGRVICNQAASNCVQCLTTADCATGVCQDRRCTTTPTGAGGAAGSGGGPSVGGFSSSGGSMSDTGGFTSTGGSLNDTGGSPGTGGSLETGGVASTGGWPNTGGFWFSGGFTSTGGRTSTGGFTFTGGFTSTGGRASTGGSPGTGGAGGCVAAQCPACTLGNGKCCTPQGRCGCLTLFIGACN